MSEIPIRAEALEAAAKAVSPYLFAQSPHRQAAALKAAQEMVTAFCEAEGLTVEIRALEPDLCDHEQRLVGMWRDVKEER